MVKLNKIYTKTGDKGETGLGDGSRVPKHAARVAAYGTVDETNAVLGLARLETAKLHDGGAAEAMLGRIQNDLFDVGADLCTPEQENPAYLPLRVTADQVARLEAEIDTMNAELKPLESFILPGGGAAAAWLHLARTTARRAERLITELAEDETINPQTIAYMNRLSDHLFVMGRFLNDKGAADVLWVPGANR
jgi:cob(I)alamin adenosyltransferase